MSKPQTLMFLISLILSTHAFGQSRAQCERWSEQF